MRALVFVCCLGLLAWSAGRPAYGATPDVDTVVREMTTLNQSAIDAYSEGQINKAKAHLQKAIALGNKNGLSDHPVMARTYLHLGILYVDWFEDVPTAVKHFKSALEISPDIRLTSALATKTAKSAFDQARAQLAAGTPSSPASGAPVKAGTTPSTLPSNSPPPTPSPPTPPAAKVSPPAAPVSPTAAAPTLAPESSKKTEAASAQRTNGTPDNSRPAQNNNSAATERVSQLEKEKADREKQLGEAKQRIKQLDAEKQDRDKQIGELKQRVSQLDKEKQDRDRQLAEVKVRIQQLEKEKQDKDKLLADLNQRATKERETKEKLEKDKLLADAREKDRKSKEEHDKRERERLALGPEFPNRLPEPIYCPVSDQAAIGSDLFVHCAAQPGVKAKAKVLSFYYRPTGASHYNSLVMEPSKRGWSVAVVPSGRLTGKVLQYYVEARDARDSVVASVGKASSPNILTLQSPAPAIADTSRTAADASKAVSTAKH